MSSIIARYVPCCVLVALAVSIAALTALSPAQAAVRPKRNTEAATPAKPTPPGTQSLGKIDSWSAYASQDKTGRVCYLVGQPQKSESAGAARKSPMVMVTHRPAEKIANVVSLVEGYQLKDGSEVSLDLGGGSKFDLFTKDDSAWARTSDTDKAIVTALAKSRQAVVKGVPQKGAQTTDIYALSGFGKALALIDKACGVKRDETPASVATPAPAVPVHTTPVHKKAKVARHAKARRAPVGPTVPSESLSAPPSISGGAGGPR